MKLIIKLFITTIICLTISTSIYAKAFMSSGFGGSTGLISTPTAKVAWENTNLAMDFGFHFIYDGNFSNIPKYTLTFLKQVEVGFAYDFQSRTPSYERMDNDFIVHGKWNFYSGDNTSIAVGFNVQGVTYFEGDDIEPYGQIYFAITYNSTFFSMPASTSMVIGKTLGEGHYNSDIDFSMGLDLDFIPQHLKHYVHWISDFANYSYSVDPTGSDHERRGCFNTGLRIAILKGDQRFKLNIDVIGTDLFDSNRGFATGITFGVALL